MILALLDNACREIARNGLKKIVLISAHGGNRFLIPYFLDRQREKAKDYVAYGISGIGSRARPEVPWDAAVNGHAGPGETSMRQFFTAAESPRV